MLQLINVKKDYQTTSQTVHALKGINLRFRKNGVSIFHRILYNT